MFSFEEKHFFFFKEEEGLPRISFIYLFVYLCIYFVEPVLLKTVLLRLCLQSGKQSDWGNLKVWGEPGFSLLIVSEGP